LEERMLSFDPVDLCPITLVFATRENIAKGRALAGFVAARMALRVGLRGFD
jgi:hypothetical protein